MTFAQRAQKRTVSALNRPCRVRRRAVELGLVCAPGYRHGRTSPPILTPSAFVLEIIENTRALSVHHQHLPASDYEHERSTHFSLLLAHAALHLKLSLRSTPARTR